VGKRLRDSYYCFAVGREALEAVRGREDRDSAKATERLHADLRRTKAGQLPALGMYTRTKRAYPFISATYDVLLLEILIKC